MGSLLYYNCLENFLAFLIDCDFYHIPRLFLSRQPDSQQCYTAIEGVWNPTLRTLQDRVGEGSVAQLTDGRAFMFGGNTTDT